MPTACKYSTHSLSRNVTNYRAVTLRGTHSRIGLSYGIGDVSHELAKDFPAHLRSNAKIISVKVAPSQKLFTPLHVFLHEISV